GRPVRTPRGKAASTCRRRRTCLDLQRHPAASGPGVPRPRLRAGPGRHRRGGGRERPGVVAAGRKPGEGRHRPPADELRAVAELADRRRQVFQYEEAVRVASAELVRLLRLDPAVTLLALEGEPAPICMVDPRVPLPALLAQGLSSRPELAE